jgi:hypothetical protein
MQHHWKPSDGATINAGPIDASLIQETGLADYVIGEQTIHE